MADRCNHIVFYTKQTIVPRALPHLCTTVLLFNASAPRAYTPLAGRFLDTPVVPCGKGTSARSLKAASSCSSGFIQLRSLNASNGDVLDAIVFWYIRMAFITPSRPTYTMHITQVHDEQNIGTAEALPIPLMVAATGDDCGRQM